MRVIAVPIDHQVNVHVPKTGQKTHTFSRDDFGIFGNLNLSDLPHFGNFFTFDDDDTVANRMTAIAVNERSSHQGFYIFLLRKNQASAQ